jgi:hypothetical protein
VEVVFIARNKSVWKSIRSTSSLPPIIISISIWTSKKMFRRVVARGFSSVRLADNDAVVVSFARTPIGECLVHCSLLCPVAVVKLYS